MKLSKITRTLAHALLLVPSTMVLAQADDSSTKMYVSFGQNIAQNHSLTLAGKPWGGPGSYHAEMGLELYHAASTLTMRPNAGYTRILSDPNEPERDEFGYVVTPAPTVYDLLGVFIGIDLVYNVSQKLPLTFTCGPSFHSWSVEQSNNMPLGPSTAKRQGERNLKLGWRLGLGYDFEVKDYPLRVDFTYTMTEWRSKASLGYIKGLNPSLPSYYTLKASYTF